MPKYSRTPPEKTVDYVLNRETGRLVKKSGRIGASIMKARKAGAGKKENLAVSMEKAKKKNRAGAKAKPKAKKLSRTPSPMKGTHVLNRETKRLVLRTGKKGKEILKIRGEKARSKSKSKSPVAKAKPVARRGGAKHHANDIMHYADLQGWKFLGAGAGGIAFEFQHPYYGQMCVAKVVVPKSAKAEREFDNEVEIHRIAQVYDNVPNLYETFQFQLESSGDRAFCMILEHGGRYLGDLAATSKTQCAAMCTPAKFARVVDTLKSLAFDHGIEQKDDNIMNLLWHPKKKQFSLIDFGMAKKVDVRRKHARTRAMITNLATACAYLKGLMGMGMNHRNSIPCDKQSFKSMLNHLEGFEIDVLTRDDIQAIVATGKAKKNPNSVAASKLSLASKQIDIMKDALK